MNKFYLLVALLISSSATMAQVDLLYPEIEKYGGVVEVPENAFAPNMGDKIVIDIVNGADDASQLNRDLDRVARLINLYKLNGINPDQTEIKVVLHGGATSIALSDEAYLSQLRVSNPNADIMQALLKRGVSFYVCGQSFFRKGYEQTDLHPQVTMALSAMTTLIAFQKQGYQALYF